MNLSTVGPEEAGNAPAPNELTTDVDEPSDGKCRRGNVEHDALDAFTEGRALDVSSILYGNGNVRRADPDRNRSFEQVGLPNPISL